VLRSESLAVIDTRRGGTAVPRIFGARVLRADHVGIERPIPLSVPAVPMVRSLEPEVGLEEQSAPPSPDFAAIEEAARLQGYNLGYEQGQAAGMAAAEQTMSEMLRQLGTLLMGIQENHAGFFRAAERQVVDLSLQIAAKVVEREVENMPDMAVSVIRSALEEMDARTAVRVRVNPDDAELLQRRWSSVVPAGVPADRIELQSDERISSGGGVIETTHGSVDAQLDTKLEQLGNALWTFVMETSNGAEGGEVEQC
jgi:flagellar assembly protein FliH